MKPRACALILDEQENILLIRRVKGGREYWVFPGGSVEHEESYERAVIREIKEETSLNVSIPTLMLENMNAGRRERYFRFAKLSGSAKLGDGPEIKRLSAANIYEPVWVPLPEFLTINVLPAEIKSDVVTLWRSGSL